MNKSVKKILMQEIVFLCKKCGMYAGEGANGGLRFLYSGCFSRCYFVDGENPVVFKPQNQLVLFEC